MSKKIVIWLMATLFLVAVSLAQAQQTTKVPRIGLLSTLSPSTIAARMDAFRQGLRELGYVEGKNILIEYRWAEGKLDRMPNLAGELVRLKVDLIITTGPPATRAGKEATNTIPIVMAFDTDPVGNGFVATLARPGGKHHWIVSPLPGDKRKTVGDSKGDPSQALPHSRPGEFDGASQRAIVKRDGARRRDVRSEASIR